MSGRREQPQGLVSSAQLSLWRFPSSVIGGQAIRIICSLPTGPTESLSGRNATPQTAHTISTH